MNLPFFHSKKEVQEEPVRRIPAPPAPTKIITSASVRREMVPPIPERYQVETLMECLVIAFIEGLFDVGFDLKILAGEPDIKAKLNSQDYEMPEYIWEEINKLSCDEQARVVYAMLRAMHVWYAFKLIEKPETFKGKEFLALQLELAGEANLLSLLAELKPMLPRFGLDKGRTQGEERNMDYPSVIKVFLRTRTQLCQVYNLEDDLSLGWFILAVDSKLDYWPRELVQPFNDSSTLLGAIAGVKQYFLSPDLHPNLFRHSSD